MTRNLSLLAVLSLFVCAGLGAQQATTDEPAQFTVLRAGKLIAPSEALTNADAHCAINGTGGGATMQCKPGAVTISTSYHYNTALLVDANGTGYVVACRAALVTNLWCKKADPGTVVQGRFANGHFSIVDGQKTHDYQVLVSATVGPLPAIQPTPVVAKAKKAPKAAPAPTQPATVSAPAAAPVPASKKSADSQETAAGAPAACVSPSAACVSFTSEPTGADIYVDGKFAGNTPSTLALTSGSHEIRVESAKFKPWSRTLETTAGSKVNLRATLEPSQN